MLLSEDACTEFFIPISSVRENSSYFFIEDFLFIFATNGNRGTLDSMLNRTLCCKLSESFNYVHKRLECVREKRIDLDHTFRKL